MVPAKHRPNAITDASALTETALSKLIKSQKSSQGLVLRDNLVKISVKPLSNLMMLLTFTMGLFTDYERYRFAQIYQHLRQPSR